MAQYRTEVVIPEDRCVYLKLPPHLPAGWATVTVLLGRPGEPGPLPAPEADPDRQDIEWWEEFEDEVDPAR